MTAHFVGLLDELRRHSLRMASLVVDLVEEACAAAVSMDQTLARRVIARDNDVDREEVAVETEVIRLMALYQPVGSDLRLLCTVLKVNNDLERIADCAVNIAERAQHLDRDALPGRFHDVDRMSTIVQSALASAIKAYATEDADIAAEVLQRDDVIDATYGDIVRATIVAATEQPDRMAAHLDVLSIAKNLERIADHATNVAEDVIFLATGQIVRHQTVDPNA